MEYRDDNIWSMSEEELFSAINKAENSGEIPDWRLYMRFLKIMYPDKFGTLENKEKDIDRTS